MSHELDDRWTLYTVTDRGGGNVEARVDGFLTLKIGANGAVDRSVSRHAPNGGTATEVGGQIDPHGPGYKITLIDYLSGGRRQIYRGGLVTRISGNLIIGGFRLAPEGKVKAKKRSQTKALDGQEEGTWVGTKP